MNAELDKKPEVAPKKAGGMDLSGMNLSSLMSAPEPSQEGSGPLRVLVDLISEDPSQPRGAENPGFSPESIAEIGETIKDRGVKSPISVREDPENPGRFIINDGARRYRGTKWAGVLDIPVFIDNDYVSDDQVVANIQREGHTAHELADLIAKRLAAGMKKSEIAKKWGKSAAFITQYAALLNLPKVIAEAFNSGRIKDVTVVNELLAAYKNQPQEVTDWLADENQEVTRGSVKLLREFLDDKNKDGESDESLAEQALREAQERMAGGGDEGEGDGGQKKPPKEQDPTRFKKAIVQVEINGDLCRLIQNKRPTELTLGWFKNEISGEEFEADLKTAQMVCLVEG